MRTFFVVWFGQLISLFGSQLTSFALGVWVYQNTGSVTQFALIFIFISFPLIRPLAKVLIKRLGKTFARGLMFILLGLSSIIVTMAAYKYPRLRRLEDELPDAI